MGVGLSFYHRSTYDIIHVIKSRLTFPAGQRSYVYLARERGETILRTQLRAPTIKRVGGKTPSVFPPTRLNFFFLKLYIHNAR